MRLMVPERLTAQLTPPDGERLRKRSEEPSISEALRLRRDDDLRAAPSIRWSQRPLGRSDEAGRRVRRCEGVKPMFLQSGGSLS